MQDKSRGLNRTRLLIAGFALLLVAMPASAALNAYMTVTGEAQGGILGDPTDAGHAGEIEIHEMHHLFRAEGAATAHEALILTTRMNLATPKLLTALDTNELLTVTINYWRPDPATGSEVMYYQMVLTGARLVASEPIMADNKNPDFAGYEIRTRLRLTYGSIKHVYVPSGDEATLTP